MGQSTWGVTARMLGGAHTLVLVLALANIASAQNNGDEAPFFECPEPNGKFRDQEQCDLFYICRKEVATIEYCPEGLLFDDSIPNHEKCVLPHNVDCGTREFVQEPSPDRDEKCEKANGVFNHPDETVCDKYIQCDNGRAFEFPCPNPLIFDVKVGSCVRKEQASDLARLCDGEVFNEVDGFSCPGGDVVGPQNLLQAHPIHAHPTDCRYYFSCYHNKEPNKFGCSEGNVFDRLTQVCKPAEEVDECRCWYACPENSQCPDDCNADCSCP